MPAFAFEPLGLDHDRAAFSCGVESLERYLHAQASQDVRRGLAAVYVMADRAAPAGLSAVAGYYTLSAASVAHQGLPADLARRLPRELALPAILIGRLALDRRYHGQGLGGALLFDAITRCFDLHFQLGAIAVIVDAGGDAARAFSEQYEFRRFLDDEYRLFLPMKTAGELVRQRDD